MAAQMTNMTDMAGMLLNAATAASKPTTGTLVVSIVQSAVIGIMVAPPLALFGTVVPKSVIVIQSALQFGYKELIQSIMGADLWSIGNVLQALYYNVFGALMLIIASLHREEINILNKALLTGRLLVMPAIETLAVYLFTNFAGCQLFGTATAEFAFGAPTLCKDKYDISYLASLYIYHGCQWLVIFIVGYLGSKYTQIVMIVSCAMSGSTLTLTANLTLARTILTYLGMTESLVTIDTYFTSYGSIAEYVLMGIGCLSMLTVRTFVKEMKKQEVIKQDILKMMKFQSALGRFVQSAPDHAELKKDLQEMESKVEGYREALVAKDELDFAQIWPMGLRHRKARSKAIRKMLDNAMYEEKGKEIDTQIWDYKMHKLDPSGDAWSRVGFNKQIWKMKVKVPQDEEAAAMGIKPDADGYMTMRAYHNVLADFYDRSVEDKFFPGQAMLFKNRFIPALWPAFIKFPKSWVEAREKLDDVNPNSRYKLGTHCCPPFHGFIVGPVVKNRLLTNPVTMMWFKPLVVLNVGIMNLQFSPYSPWQVMDKKLSKNAMYRGYKKTKKIGKKVMNARGWNLLKNSASVSPEGMASAAEGAAKGKLMSKINAVAALSKKSNGGGAPSSPKAAKPYEVTAVESAVEPVEDEPKKEEPKKEEP